MREARSSTTPIQHHHQQQRFCWRERTEKLNWRMLRALHLPDVVKRGDPTVLEPYVLHLTFARLPAVGTTAALDSMDARHVSDDQQRNVWFIVRVFQLATEYLLFMRSRDGTVLETLQKELRLCEKRCSIGFDLHRECEAFALRATKWKERSKSGDKQVQKLHQVLQSIAKLLQIQGATPSAVSAIETLLRDMLPKHKKSFKNSGRNQNDEDDEHTQRRVKKARQCFYCGKMFASADYLEKHHLRRHPEENKELRVAEPHEPKSIAKPHPARESLLNTNPQGSGEKALRQMLQQVEYALQDHQESLRLLAKEEANKIESLYEQLHVESQLAEEIKASRILTEKQVKDAQEQLDTVLQEKEDALTELSDLKKQIQFLDMKRKMEFQAGIRSSPSAQVDQNDMSTMLEIKRLEQALTMVNTTLSDSRKELLKLQEVHLTTLKDKQALCDQLSESQNHVKRLESKISESSGAESVPAVCKDCGSQTVASEARDVSTQAADEHAKQIKAERIVLKAEVAVQTQAEIKVFTGVEVAIQTEEEKEQLAVMAPSVQFPDLILTEAVVPSVPSPSKTSEQCPIATSPVVHQPEDGSATVSDYVYNIVAESVMDAVKNRAQRYAFFLIFLILSTHASAITDFLLFIYRAIEESAKSSHTPSSKIFSSFPERKFLRSRYQHDEQTVQERIASQMFKLEKLSHRFGVPPKCNVLSNEHLQIVQQALHGHLEVLPAEVLQKMVECESRANTVIEKEWVPREKTRQQALERLKVQTHTKSQLNQDLVKQAMTTFASVGGGDTGSQNQSSRLVTLQEERQPEAQHGVQQSGDNWHLELTLSKESVQETRPAREEFGKPFNVKDLTVIIEERPSLVERDVEEDLAALVMEEPKRDIYSVSGEDHKALDINLPKATESTPLSADFSTISPQTIEIAAVPQVTLAGDSKPSTMKAVTVSSKSSPTKPDIVNERQDQDLMLESPFIPDLDANKHDCANVSTSRSLDEVCTPSPDAEIEAKEIDQNRAGTQTNTITETCSVRDSEGEAGKEIGKGSETQRFDSSSPSTKAGNEPDEIEVIDVQIVSDAVRSPDAYESRTRYEVVGSAEREPTDRRVRADESHDQDRYTSDRNQLLRSFESSEFSTSMAASSEMSFQASIPSLEESDSNVSDTDNATKFIDKTRDSRERLTIGGRFSVESFKSETLVEPERYEGALNADENESEHDIPNLLSDDETSDLDEVKEHALLTTTALQQNFSRVHGSRYDLSANTNVMTFSDNDDSEIEEVELT